MLKPRRPPADPAAKGLLLQLSPLPPLSSALSSLPDEATLVDAGHVLGKDAGVEASAVSCHPPAWPDCVILERRRGAQSSHQCHGGDFHHNPCPNQSWHTSLEESPWGLRISSFFPYKFSSESGCTSRSNWVEFSFKHKSWNRNARQSSGWSAN